MRLGPFDTSSISVRSRAGGGGMGRAGGFGCGTHGTSHPRVAALTLSLERRDNAACNHVFEGN